MSAQPPFDRRRGKTQVGGERREAGCRRLQKGLPHPRDFRALRRGTPQNGGEALRRQAAVADRAVPGIAAQGRSAGHGKQYRTRAGELDPRPETGPSLGTGVEVGRVSRYRGGMMGNQQSAAR